MRACRGHCFTSRCSQLGFHLTVSPENGPLGAQPRGVCLSSPSRHAPARGKPRSLHPEQILGPQASSHLPFSPHPAQGLIQGCLECHPLTSEHPCPSQVMSPDISSECGRGHKRPLVHHWAAVNTQSSGTARGQVCPLLGVCDATFFSGTLKQTHWCLGKTVSGGAHGNVINPSKGGPTASLHSWLEQLRALSLALPWTNQRGLPVMY